MYINFMFIVLTPPLINNISKPKFNGPMLLYNMIIIFDARNN